ncbi:AI-2E family transporter [candidate division KSB1 bacterium]|nr:AI-2E family transporter [candidate division KSB1 bacterium]
MEQPSVLSVRFNPGTIKKIIGGFVLTLGFVALLILIPILQSVVTILIIAFFLALILNPIVNFIENRGIARLLASVLVFAMIIFLGGVGFKFLAPRITNEIKQLSSGLNEQSPGETLQKLQENLGDKIPFLSNPMIQKELKKKIDDLVKKSFSMVVNVLSAVVSIIMLAFITFFLLKDGRRMKKTVVSWVPNRYFEMTLIILHKTGTQLGRYIRGQLLVASIVGSLSIFALYLLEIKYAFFIGAMAGLANMIPYFGPIVGAVPAIIMALIHNDGSLEIVAVVAVAFATIQLFENIFVSPFIVSKSVELHPLTVIIVILIGGQLVGIFGMLLAVPTASIIKVTAQELHWGLKNYRMF